MPHGPLYNNKIPFLQNKKTYKIKAGLSVLLNFNKKHNIDKDYQQWPQPQLPSHLNPPGIIWPHYTRNRKPSPWADHPEMRPSPTTN